jgi:hypothetical protein
MITIYFVFCRFVETVEVGRANFVAVANVKVEIRYVEIK